MRQGNSAKIYSEKILMGVCNAVYFRLCIDLMHINPPDTANGIQWLPSPEICRMASTPYSFRWKYEIRCRCGIGWVVTNATILCTYCPISTTYYARINPRICTMLCEKNVYYFMLSGKISRNIGENIFRSYTGTTSENTDFHVFVD